MADGQIDDNEVKLLQRILWEDGKIDAKEVQFLIDLRNTAQKKAKATRTARHIMGRRQRLAIKAPA